ncbi:HAD-IA family hydrolase [Candidatus Daviesbacteria bacterium]|nr:HAD-IA family hydrolase [Candidatus Daviesbacteria bacterium]
MSIKDYLKKNPKTHLIFDFDETIFKLLLPWEKVLVYIENELIKLDQSIYQKYMLGKIDLNTLQNEYVSKFGKKARDLIYKNNLKFEKGHYKGVEVNPEILDFISKTDKYQIFIWSANTSEIIVRVLKEYKLLNKFKKIISRDDVNLLKPDPEGFTKIYDPQIDKEKYLFVGDSLNDKLAAQNAGVDFYLADHFI